MIKEYVPTEKGGYECFVYDADFLRRRLANVASFPGFVGVFQDPNWHTGEWFEGARVVGDDLNAFLDMVRDSGVLLSDARAAGPEDEALSTFRRKNERPGSFGSGSRSPGLCRIVQVSVPKHF
jgi:hypothetical protein